MAQLRSYSWQSSPLARPCFARVGTENGVGTPCCSMGWYRPVRFRKLAAGQRADGLKDRQAAHAQGWPLLVQHYLYTSKAYSLFSLPFTRC